MILSAFLKRKGAGNIQRTSFQALNYLKRRQKGSKIGAPKHVVPMSCLWITLATSLWNEGKEQDLQDRRVARRRIDKKILEMSRPKD